MLHLVEHSRSAASPPLGARTVEDVYSPELHGGRLQRVILCNGLTAFVLTGSGASRFFGISFPTPPISSQGTPHVLEHMILTGSKSYPASTFNAMQHASDLSIDAGTCPNHTYYSAQALTDPTWIEGARYLLDSTLYPKLSADQLSAECSNYLAERTRRGARVAYSAAGLLNEIQQDVQDPAELALRNAVKMLFPELLSEIDFAGIAQEVKTLTLSQVRDYHKKFYSLDTAVTFVAHPTSAEPILRILEQLKVPRRIPASVSTQIDLSTRTKRAHSFVSRSADMHVTDSSMVLLYPIAPPSSLADLIFLNSLQTALFHLEDNRFNELVLRYKLSSSLVVSRCGHMQLGAQHFVATEVAGLQPRNFDRTIRLLTESYGNTDQPPLPWHTLQTALSTNRYWNSSESDKVGAIFLALIDSWKRFPGAAVLLEGAQARYLTNSEQIAYPAFCAFIRNVFNQTPFIYTQTPQARRPDEQPTHTTAGRPTPVRLGSVAPLMVPSQHLHVKRLVNSARDAFVVTTPFLSEGVDAVVSTPIGDEKYLHLNIGFDFTRVPPQLRSHALELLALLDKAEVTLKDRPKSSQTILSAASSLTTRVTPIDSSGSHFFLSCAIDPDDLGSFLEILHGVFQLENRKVSPMLLGTDHVRSQFSAEIYHPSTVKLLDSSLITRGLAPFHQGFFHCDQLVGFGAAARMSKLCGAAIQDARSLSPQKTRVAAKALFSAPALLLQFSAPRRYEEQVARMLYEFYQAQRKDEPVQVFVGAASMPQNELLVAPTVAKWVARFVPFAEFTPEYLPVVQYLKFVMAQELRGRRGFYATNAFFSPVTGVLQLLCGCGSSAAAPFKVFDHLPRLLTELNPTRRQLKGLQMGAVSEYLALPNAASTWGTMLERLRLHRAGVTQQRFAEDAEDILANGAASFRNFAEMLSTKQPDYRNVVLADRGDAKALQRGIVGVEFGRPLVVKL